MSVDNKPQSPYSPLLDEQVAAGLRGDFARGWEIAEELAITHPHCNRAKFNRAWYEMMRGDLLKGLELLSAGRWERAFGDKPLPTAKPIYQSGDLNRKYILFCGEGGLGDEIINVRFASEFAKMGAKVTVTCDPGLASVFSRLSGVISVIGHRHAPDVYHDFWVPGMSAGHILQTTYEKLDGRPYLTARPDLIAKWRDWLKSSGRSRGPKVGVKFFGNPKFEHEQHRRFPKESLIQVVENALKGSNKWVNLQLEDRETPIENWEDTLAVIACLDLVITSCTSIAHASAAMGKPTWVLVPILPYYIWAKPGSTSPWYDSVRLFRQTEFGNWDQVFQELEKSITPFLKSISGS